MDFQPVRLFEPLRSGKKRHVRFIHSHGGAVPGRTQELLAIVCLAVQWSS